MTAPTPDELFGGALDPDLLRAAAAARGLTVDGDQWVVYLVRWDGVTLRRVSATWATIYPSLDCARNSVDVRGYPTVPAHLTETGLCDYLHDWREAPPQWQLEVTHA